MKTSDCTDRAPIGRSSRRCTALLGITVASAVLVLPARANAHSDSAAPTLLAPIEVQGHYDNAVGTSDAASQGVVLGERLQDLPLLRPGEVLETVPGLVVTQHSGDGKANQYFLRGYNLDHGTDFATKVDGVPVNMPTNAHGQGYSDLNFLMPELVDRIDYFKGPYFASGGDFASAGSANIQYRNNLDHPFASLTLGSHDYRRMQLAGSIPVTLPWKTATTAAESGKDAASTQLLGALDLMGSNGPWTTPEGLHRANGLLRLSHGDRANGWSADGLLYDASWHSTDQVPLELIESGQLGRYSAIDPTDGGDSGRAILSGEWHMHADEGYTRASAYLEHYRLRLWSNFTFFELRPATGDQFEQSEHRDILGGEFVHGWNHRLLGRESVTEAGLQLRHDNIRVSLQNTDARVPFETVSDNKVRETEAALYLQNTTSWSSWFRSLAGVRQDRIFLGMNALATPQNSGNASDSRVSPKLSLIFGPWAKTELFANIGRGFHSNDARGVLDRVDPTTGAAADRVPALVGSLGKEGR